MSFSWYDETPGIPLDPRTTLHPNAQWRVVSATASDDAATLGAGEPLPNTPLELFTLAGSTVVARTQTLPSATLGDPDAPPATLDYAPEDDAVYALLQTIETPNGTIYDLTLPQRVDDQSAVLGAEGEPLLRFPVHQLVGEAGETGEGGAATLGIEDVIGGFVADVVAKRVLHVIKTPLDRALLQHVQRSETRPVVRALRGDSLLPVDGFDTWRALLPPGATRRVLLFLHGFGSTTARSAGATFLPAFANGYDAVLAYDHPTLTRDPLENALDLLARVPEDLDLHVDIVAHSRGGLVARSLVELVAPRAHFAPRTIITHGTPHNGTRLAEPERWDRLVSLGLTAASWLATSVGAAFWAPKLLEYVLKAAAQSVFALPGIEAMTPHSAFLERLNAAADPATAAGALQSRVRYAAVLSQFSGWNTPELNVVQGLRSLAAQAFIDAPNDLIVPTDSMGAFDYTETHPAVQYRATVDHFSYFRDPGVAAFIHEQLRSL